MKSKFVYFLVKNPCLSYCAEKEIVKLTKPTANVGDTASIMMGMMMMMILKKRVHIDRILLTTCDMHLK